MHHVITANPSFSAVIRHLYPSFLPWKQKTLSPRGERVAHAVPPTFNDRQPSFSLRPITGASGTPYSAHCKSSVSGASSQVVFAGFTLRKLAVGGSLSLQRSYQLLVPIAADARARGPSAPHSFRFASIPQKGSFGKSSATRATPCCSAVLGSYADTFCS